MRYLVFLIGLVVIAACGGPVARKESQASSRDQLQAGGPQDASIDSVAHFLITAAATDFRTHHPPDPVRFREVRLGHMLTPRGNAEYILCGQFLQAPAGSAELWTPFVTIKTSGYEQYIGGQAARFCQDSSVIWDKVNDLSSALQDRFDSLR